MDDKLIPLKEAVAASVEASIEERYEVLDKIGKTMNDDEREVFFELVRIIKSSIEKQK